MLFAHARRAFVLGDLEGSCLRFSLLSDAGFLLGQLNAAWLWDQSAADKLSIWQAFYKPFPKSKEAFLYYRWAAVSGHTTSMTELSVRLLKEAEVGEAQNSQTQTHCRTHRTTCATLRYHSNSKISELQQSAYRWTALAELGEARAIFDQAYISLLSMLQFSVVEQSEVLAGLPKTLSKARRHELDRVGLLESPLLVGSYWMYWMYWRRESIWICARPLRRCRRSAMHWTSHMQLEQVFPRLGWKFMTNRKFTGNLRTDPLVPWKCGSILDCCTLLCNVIN